MRNARWLSFSLAWLGALASACSGGGRAPTPKRTADDPLCPLCEPAEGGDSSGGGGRTCPSGPPTGLSGGEFQPLLDASPALFASFEAQVGGTKGTEESREWREEPDTKFPTGVLRASGERSGEPVRIALRPADAE